MAQQEPLDRDVDHQQRLLLSLLDNIPGMVYRGMPDWSISFVGSEVERLTGFTPAEILGRPKAWRGLIHPDDFRSVRETILIAEDEEAIRTLAERSLRGYGYEILAARDGTEAVALFEAHPEIAIAVLDVVMPGMGGKEAFDAMRRLRPGMKVLFSSGYSTDRIHESFVLLPGIEFLPKPYGPGSLARRVREVLDKV